MVGLFRSLVRPPHQPELRQEIAGYRDVLATIHASHEHVKVRPGVILQLHRDLYKFSAEPGGHWRQVDNLERIIEESKESYYGALKASSEGWHEGQHSLAPWRDYLLGTIVAACRELKRRVELVTTAPGAKRNLVRDMSTHFAGEFTTRELEMACPGVSRELLRIVLRELEAEGVVVATGEKRWQTMEENTVVEGLSVMSWLPITDNAGYYR